MNMLGDGPDGQPGEGVVSLSDLAGAMDESEAVETPEDLPEGEDGEEPEVEGDESEAEEPEEGEEPRFTIKVDGKDVELTQSELIERAQKGTDYTQKTMQVAEERKAVEAERAQVAQHRQQYESTLTETANRLDAWTKFMESSVGHMPDVSLLDYDSGAYIRQKEQYEARMGQLNQAYAARQQLAQEQARERQAWINERATATEKVLKDTLPDWNDDTLHALADYTGKLGLTPQTAEAALLEPGFWQLAHKAKAYDALLAEKAKLKPKVDLPRVQKPSAANHPGRGQTKRAEAEKQYAAKPSLNTLSALIE